MGTKVSIIEDDDQRRSYYCTLLTGTAGYRCAGAHASAAQALRGLAREKPHVIVLSLPADGREECNLIPRLKTRAGGAEVLALAPAGWPLDAVLEVLAVGATGYLIRPVTPLQLLDSIAELQAGGSPIFPRLARLLVTNLQHRGPTRRQLENLSPRELEILQSAATGLRNGEIARHLRLSPDTVRTHLRNIYEKLHVHSRVQAAARLLHP